MHRISTRYRETVKSSKKLSEIGSERTPRRSIRVLLGIVEDPKAPAPAPLKVGLSEIELADQLRGQFYKDRNFLRFKRRRWAVGAVVFRVIALSLSVTATILLGLANLSGPAALGFALSALVTTVTALEPFFNFRSRWVSADEALARWHSAEEELSAYVASVGLEELEKDRIIELEEKRRAEWARFSNDWLNERRSADRT